MYARRVAHEISSAKVKHRAELRAAAQAWRDAHPELARAKYLRRHARRRGAPIRDLTAAQWQAIKDHFDHCCVYCGRHMQRLTQDHIIPLSKGGSHTMSNIVPACQSCNSRKGNREVVCPVEPLLRLPED
jgi:5-methylcytosine-specific restriction endonuclease McrA